MLSSTKLLDYTTGLACSWVRSTAPGDSNRTCSFPQKISLSRSQVHVAPHLCVKPLDKPCAPSPFPIGSRTAWRFLHWTLLPPPSSPTGCSYSLQQLQPRGTAGSAVKHQLAVAPAATTVARACGWEIFRLAEVLQPGESGFRLGGKCVFKSRVWVCRTLQRGGLKNSPCVA